jgi:hypothetical protein
MTSSVPACWSRRLHSARGCRRAPQVAGAAAARGLVTTFLLRPGYLTKCQYSGSSVYSALKVTPFSLLLTAWIPYGAGTQLNGNCFAA